jgi:replicative DNA helicase
MASGSLTPMDFMNIDDANRRVPENLTLDDCAALSIEDVERKVWALSRRGKIGAVVIDYLQLMRRPKANGRNEASVLGEITMRLKQLARRFKITIILLSQLSRQVESRDDKRPTLADLRESGSIEQDADVVLFPFREFYYLQKAEPPSTQREKYLDWEMRCQDTRRRLDVICGKQRAGPEGTDRQAYYAEYDFIEDGEDDR